MITKLPPLYKFAKTKTTHIWQIEVEKINDQHGIVRTEWGTIDGKKQIVEEHIVEGCNIGKSNETTPYRQALLVMQQTWDHQLQRNKYGQNIEQSKDSISLSPMLAKVYKDHKDKVDWNNAFVQPKFDGNRCLARNINGVISLISRTGKEIISVPHIVTELSELMSDNEVFDGELYIHGKPLNQIRSLISRKQPDSSLLKYRVYDQVCDNSFSGRYDDLVFLFKNHKEKSVILVPTIKIGNEKELMDWQTKFVADGYEGAILRHGDLPYESGRRSTSLLKVKTFQDDEFKIINIKEGKGTYEGMAIFTCITKDGNEFDVTSPGTFEEKRQTWIDRYKLIGKQLTVKFQFLTATDNPVPFLPIAIAIRNEE